MNSFKIIRIIAAVLLLFALAALPYGFYMLLRFIVCGIAAYSAYISYQRREIGWTWTFGVIALLFNPLMPVYLGREIWALVDVAVAVILVVSVRKIK